MKKILTIAFVAIALAFAGCSGGDDDPNTEGGNNNGNVENNGNNDKDDDDEDIMPQPLTIVGSWEMYRSVWHGYGSDTETSEPIGEEYGERILMRFWDDGRGVEIEMEYYGGKWHESEYMFTYSLEGDRIYVQYSEPYDDTPEIYQIVKLTPEDLILKDSGETDEVTNFYKRI